MNASLMTLEIMVALLGCAVLLVDLWTPPDEKRQLGYLAAVGLAAIFLSSFGLGEGNAFANMYVLDGLALFFKRFFLFSGVIVLLLSVEFADRIHNRGIEFEVAFEEIEHSQGRLPVALVPL